MYSRSYLDDHRLCCQFNQLESFDQDKCFTIEKQSPLFKCGSLMQNTFLRCSLWVLGLSALIGNLVVVVWRVRSSLVDRLGEGTKYVLNLLVLNLAVADFLMGVYMIIIAAADYSYGESYYKQASEWRLTSLCKAAGVLSVLSSEASVFFITLISVDRFLCIVLPMGSIRLTKGSARKAAAVIWVSALVMSSLPTMLVGSESDVYGLSDVCIGLPLTTKPASYRLQHGGIGTPLGSYSVDIPVPQDHRPAWVYSIVIFLGLNLVCFLVIAVCYAAIVVNVRAANRKFRGSRFAPGAGAEEAAMALRLAVIVGSDFLCWMPVIVMGILSQSGAVTIAPSMYAWTVVVILPVNSSINPYIYTVISLVSARLSKPRGGAIPASPNAATEPTGKTNRLNRRGRATPCHAGHHGDAGETRL